MATLVFSALGTLIGGPLGGALGALAGRQVDSLIFGGGNREGPRLKELAATASSYGTVLPRHFGQMRVAGSIIWATDLVEHKQTQGSGKGKPSVTTYSYTASFAVALASRPILSVGRIWADGNLLRGAAGDLKASGTFRLYTGEGDQQADPHMLQVEGASRCPAYRGLAYAVFEDLDLGEFFNRIPSLTFEVISDIGTITVQTILDGVISDIDAGLALDGIDGYSCEGPLSETLSALDPMFPMDADAGGELLTIARGRLQSTALALPEAAVATDDGDFGAHEGYARKREPLALSPSRGAALLRYRTRLSARAATRDRAGQPWPATHRGTPCGADRRECPHSCRTDRNQSGLGSRNTGLAHYRARSCDWARSNCYGSWPAWPLASWRLGMARKGGRVGSHSHRPD
jgi:hypothetical protein